MKVKDSPAEVKKLIHLVKDIRPDQAVNFARADKWFVENFSKQFPEEEIENARHAVEIGLRWHEGTITVTTIFKWMKVDILKRFKANKIPQKGYYNN
jgi:hypothetical protein